MSERILIVEDDTDMRELLEEILAEENLKSSPPPTGVSLWRMSKTSRSKLI